MPRGFCIQVEIDLHAITCPGVWLCPNGKVALRISTLKSTIESHRISPVFPLLFHDKFTFKMVFSGITSLAALQSSLEEEFFYAELLQWTESSKAFIILSTFETNLADLLYPSSCSKGLLAGVDVDLLMEATKFFPGILAPKIEISTKTMVEEVAGIYSSNTSGAFITNPKVIHSKNGSNINRKQPAKGIIRQRKVCHSKGKARQQSCPCKKTTKLKMTRSSSPVSSDRYSESQSDCYHKKTKRSNFSQFDRNVDRESHKLENCPVCSKYNCYFSEYSEESEELGYRNMNNRKINSFKVYEPMKSSHFEKENCFCQPNSTQDSTSVLKDRIHRLQKTKENLAQTNDSCMADRYCICEQAYVGNNRRPGFYKSLEKFYKRMYKQAKLRAEQIDCY